MNRFFEATLAAALVVSAPACTGIEPELRNLL